MENATKALTMAGGILIAIMVIATLLYAATTWGIFPSAKDETDVAKQLAKFNQQYESYNKGALYGTDVITVLNKARDNNRNLTKEEKETLYLNIEVALISNVEGTETTYKNYIDAEDPEPDIQTTGPILTIGSYLLDGVGSKKLEKFLDDFMADSGRVNIKNEKSGRDENGKYYHQYTVEKVPNSEFKIKAFTCEKVKYNDIGRICYMKFTEINTN